MLDTPPGLTAGFLVRHLAACVSEGVADQLASLFNAATGRKKARHGFQQQLASSPRSFPQAAHRNLV
jgi:hypothetical protein